MSLVAGLSLPAVAQEAADGVYESPPVEPLAVDIGRGHADPPPAAVDVPEGVADVVDEGAIPAPRQESDDVAQVESDGAIETDAHMGIDNLSPPIQNFAGINSFLPPDTVGDVGADHVVQMVNATQFQVWDKQGTSLAGPTTFGNLWVNAGDTGICSLNLGDPIVVYDHLADRWVLSQFASTGRDAAGNPQAPFGICVAVSQTPDPSAGTWYLYEFGTGNTFPDYPKFGVWPDGYYVSTFESSNLGVYVFDRNNMVLGNAATFLKDTIGALGAAGVRATRILPADLDGDLPPPGTPNYFVRTVDDQQDPGSADRIEIYTASVDWLASTFNFSLSDTLGPAAFDIMLCNRNGNGTRDCIPQPDTTGTVDALSNRPMMQLKYRNFGSHQAMVFNQTIDVSGSIAASTGITPANEVAGIRWYELRDAGAGWGINDQGTYAPQPIAPDDEPELVHRWMGSAAMDQSGNIAMGFSIGNGDSDNGEELYPGLSYAGRLADDPVGTLAQGEQVLIAGTSSAGGTTNRWGDYSALSVDPVDDCTFWFTSHVATGATQIGSFQFDACGDRDAPADLLVNKICKPDEPLPAGETGFCDIFVDNLGPNDAFDVELVDQVVTDTTLTSLTAVTDQGSCVVDGLKVTCALGHIAAGGRVTVHVEFSADEPGDVNDLATVSAANPDPDTTNNRATESVNVAGVSDLSLTKDATPDPVVAGTDLTYTLTVTNDGPSTAVNTVVADVLSPKVEVVSVSATGGGSCEAGTPGDPSLPTTCTFGSIAPSASREVTIVVTVSPDALGLIHNDASTSSDHFDPDNSDNVATVATTVVVEADLAISKADFPDPVVAGETLSYELTVTNDGPSTAHGVVVTDTLPDEVVFGSVTVANLPGTCVLLDTPPNTVSCELATVQPNAPDPAVITIETTVRPDVPDGTTITDTAAVSATTPDPNGANDSDSEDTLVEAVADLGASKTSDKDVYSPSDNIVYTVSVTNNGPSDAQDVVLVDALPMTDKKVIYVHDDSGCVYAPSPAHTVTCTVGTLPAGATFTADITIAIKGNLGTLTNVASASTSTTDPLASNDSVSYDVLVTGGSGKGGGPP